MSCNYFLLSYFYSTLHLWCVFSSLGFNVPIAMTIITSCARGDTICPGPLLPRGRPSPRAPPSRRNVAVVSLAEYVPTLTAPDALRVKAALSKAAWWPWPWPLTFWPFDLESGVWDVRYFCANFGLPIGLCSRLRPDIRDRQINTRQTDRQTSDKTSLNAPAY